MLHFLHERITGKKNSDTGKTKTRRQRSLLHSRQVLEQVRVPLVPQPYSCPTPSTGLAQESPTGPSPKTTESCRTAAPQNRPALHSAAPAWIPGPERLPRRWWRAGGVRRAGARGAAAATASLFLPDGLPTQGAAAQGSRDRREGSPGPEAPEAARRVLFP